MVKADLIVVGGGIFGCATAYYYSRNNPDKKVILLERQELCTAATSRAAALMTRVRAYQKVIPLSLETYRVVHELEQFLGESIPIQKVGMLHVAASDANVKSLESLMQIADAFGIEATYITAAEAQQKAPWLDATAAQRIGWIPDEAFCDPYLLGMAFANAAKKKGAILKTGVEVTGWLTEGNSVVGVQTAEGNFEAPTTVLATGTWANVLAMKLNVPLAGSPIRSQYWITERAPIFPANSPIVLLPDARAYARPESGSLLFGLRENEGFWADARTISPDLTGYSFSADNGHQDLINGGESLEKFFPALQDIGIKHYVAGFSGYTPDSQFVIGKPANIAGLIVASGCCGAGISICGGVGKGVAELAANRPCSYDFSDFSLERFGYFDPFSDEWMRLCASARSQKKSG